MHHNNEYSLASRRADVPALRSGEIYLDNAATTLTVAPVIDAITQWYSASHASVYRGLYQRAEHATEQFENVRTRVAAWIGARSAQEIVFTRGATEGCNVVALSWLAHKLQPGDEIVVTGLEHHANLLPWHELARQKNCRVVAIPLREDFSLCLDNLAELITERTRLVAISGSSHIVGPYDGGQVMRTIVQAAREVGAAVLIDAAQMMAHQRINVQAMDVDFVVFSGHKMFGPTGIGVLYCAERVHDQMMPVYVGGGMVADATAALPVWLPMPRRLEAGTPSIAEVIGLGAAVEYLEKMDMCMIQQHEAHLTRLLVEALQQLPEVNILGNVDRLKTYGHMVTCTVAGMHPHDVAAEFAARGICVRAGNHCAQALHERLGISGSVRMSFAWYTTEADVYACIDAFRKLLRV
jgi:cysteine desulfurase/selenocysteine lyase